jgi:outer membrane protein OmpA-like peptidoglycan-associated protein
VTKQILAEDMAFLPPVVVPEPEPAPVVVVPEPQPVVPQKSTGEQVRDDLPFVAPEEEFDINDLKRDFELTIYFAQGSNRVDPYFGDNYVKLNRLMTAIRRIESSKDSRISRVVIGGFASPEGDNTANMRLAQRRAEAAKSYLLNVSNLSDSQITLYNGGEDWAGLRKLVEASGMPWANRVIDIIDNVPIWDSYSMVGREGALMRLDGGNPYRYMLRNLYPQLRNAAYIQVFFEDK